MNNEKIRVAGVTFGEGNNAIVGSVISNEGGNPRAPILTDYPPLLSKYTDRDSVAFYTGNKNRNKTLQVDGIGVTYNINSVTVPTSVSLDDVKVGMIIDTLHTPNEFTGYIEKIEENTITVKNGWFEKIPTIGSSSPSIPSNGIGFDVDRVTKIWANNSNIFLDSDKDCQKGVVNESGCFNYLDVYKEIGIFDGINFENPIEYIYRARSRYDKGKVKYGFRAEKNIETAFSFLAGDIKDKLLESIVYHNGVKDDAHSFSILANGEQNKLRLNIKSYGDGHLKQTNNLNKILFISKTIQEDFTITTPFDKHGELIFIRNVGTVKQKILIENNLNFITTSGSAKFVKVNIGGSLVLTSDGSNWVVLFGDYEGSLYLSKNGGTVNGNISVIGDINTSGSISTSSALTTNGTIIATKGNIVTTDSNGCLKTSSSAWDAGHIVLGAYHIWVDDTGKLRIKNGSPTNDTDGTIVGGQV